MYLKFEKLIPHDKYTNVLRHTVLSNTVKWKIIKIKWYDDYEMDNHCSIIVLVMQSPEYVGQWDL